MKSMIKTITTKLATAMDGGNEKNTLVILHGLQRLIGWVPHQQILSVFCVI